VNYKPHEIGGRGPLGGLLRQIKKIIIIVLKKQPLNIFHYIIKYAALFTVILALPGHLVQLKSLLFQ